MSSTIKRFHEKYFEIIEDYFGIHYEKMKEKGRSPVEAALKSIELYDTTLAVSVVNSLLDELSGLDWNSLENSVKQQSGLKSLVQSPTEALNLDVAKRIALYADTTIFSGFLLNPFRRQWHQLVSPSWRIYAAIRTSLELLEIKDLFLSDISPPIAVLARPTAFSDVEVQKNWRHQADLDSCALFSQVFGKKFSSISEVLEFVSRYKTLDELCKNRKNVKLFVSTSRPEGYDFKKEMHRIMAELYYTNQQSYSGLRDPYLLLVSVGLLTAFVRSTSALFFSCGSLRAEPFVDDSKFWHCLLSKLESDNRLIAGKLGVQGISKDSLVMNALRMSNFKWLGNVPIDGLIRMREEGELQNLRDDLGTGIKDIRIADDEDFVEVTKQVSYNFNQLFKRHKAQVKRLDEKYRRKYSIDATTLVVGGSVSMVSALFPPLAMAAGILGTIIGGGSITQMWRHVIAERSKRRELQRKPIGLLFKTYQDSGQPRLT